MNDVHRFRSMGCDIAVGGGTAGERRAIEQLFADQERIFSRFHEQSELNRVNAAAGSPVRVSRTFANMLNLALAAAEQTGGIFDPTLGSALEAAGYDADFATLRPDPRPPGPPARGAWKSVRLVGLDLAVPAHIRLDLNGVVKGQTVDGALTILQGDGFVSAGGDLAVRGATVVALPRGGTVSVLRGALATSGTDRRRWSRGGIEQHHLAALALANRYRRRLPYRVWRRAHYLNFAVWSAATLHGIGSGTDRNAPWALALYAAASGSVAATIVWRVLRLRPRMRGIRPPIGAAAAGLAATALVVLLATGPFRFHPRPWNAATFREGLTGRVVHLNGITRGIVSMTGEGVGVQRVLVRADLLMSAQRVLRTAFQMEYLPSGLRCAGTVTRVHQLGFDATCQTPVGAKRVVHARWQESGTADLAGGVISASA